MKEKRKALGKGLEQLFSDESFTFEELENDIIDDAITYTMKKYNYKEYEQPIYP